LSIGGVATTLNLGAVTGITTVRNSLTVNGATILRSTTVDNIAATYTVDATTVDTYSGVVIKQTTQPSSVTIINPTTITSGHIFTISNSSLSDNPLKIGTYSIAKGQSGQFVWDGAAWNAPSGSVTVENGLTVTDGKVALGGTLTVSKTEITTASDKTLAIKNLQTGAATENVVTVAADGVLHQRALDLGVTPIKKVTESYTITTADYTVVLKGSVAANVNFTLPTLVLADAGRTFRIINLSAKIITLDKPIQTAVDVTITEVGPGTASVAGNTMGNKLTIQWDGTEWIQVGN